MTRIRTESPEAARLLEVYDAFAKGRLECIPHYFAPDGFYRTSGVFPGMQDRYTGHDEISVFWHAATEPWECLEIETERMQTAGDLVVTRVWLEGRGLGSGVDVRIEAGHLVRFRELKITEFWAFASWDLAHEEFERLTA